MPFVAGADGSRLALVSGRFDFDRNGVFRPPQGAAVFPAGADEPRFVGWWGGIEQEMIDVGSGSGPIVAPYARMTLVGAGTGLPARYFVADNTYDQVHVIDGAGGVRRIVRWTRERRRVEDGWVEAWKEAQRAMDWTRGQLPRLEQSWLRMTVNETLPAFDAVAIDSEACLWVLRPGRLTGESGVFDVFDADGRLLGTVDAPAGYRGGGTPPAIGRDYFMASVEGGLGIETVRVYALDRGVSLP